MVAVGLTALFTLLTAWSVLVEYSVLAARPATLDALLAERSAGTRSAVLAAVSAPERVVAGSQVWISAATVLAGWSVAPVLGAPVEKLLAGFDLSAGLVRAIGVGIGWLLAAFVVTVVGELLPRSVALAAPEPVAVAVVPLYKPLAILSRGPAELAHLLASGVARLLGVGQPRRGRSVEELHELVERAAEVGELGREEHTHLAGALSFGATTVAEMMTPRSELVTVPSTATVAQAQRLMHRSGHSRVLVTGEDQDEVIGFLHAKDLIALGAEHEDQFLPPRIVRVALRCDPGLRADELLVAMRSARRHVAVVTEGDRMVGLVTLEDVLDALVGHDSELEGRS